MNEQSEAARMNGTCPSAGSAFLVIGNHPVMRRPDKVFRGDNARGRAYVYASVLTDQGYENVGVEKLPNARLDRPEGAKETT